MLDANDFGMLIATSVQIRSILEQLVHQMVIVDVITNVRYTISGGRHSGAGENPREAFWYWNHIVEVVRVTQYVVPFVHVDETEFVVHNLQNGKSWIFGTL